MAASNLDDEITQDRLSVESIRRLTEEAIGTLLASQLSDGAWPYELVAGAPVAENPKFSASTQAMILHALASSVGMIDGSALVPALQGTPPFAHLESKVRPRVVLGSKLLIEQIDAMKQSTGPADASGDGGAPVAAPSAAPLVSRSATWGLDDPLTLTWLWEVASGLEVEELDEEVAALKSRIAQAATDRLQAALATPPRPLLTTLEAPAGGSTAGVHRHAAPPHPFILLRVVQLAMCVGDQADLPTMVRHPALESLFRNALNQELANSSVQDGGFDPASLVFSLEGLTILNPDLVQENLLDRVLEVLASAQGTGSHWRPVRPIESTPQGLVLLPQSIEVANSFLRICASWEALGRGPLFSQSLPVFRQYAEWAVASSARIVVAGGVTRTGWQSEHTHVPGTIHLWATSQTILFLEHYAAMLDRHIARSSREVANLEFRPAASRSEEERRSRWAKESEHEPLQGLSSTSSSRIYMTADRLFVAPHVSNAGKANYSMLLYGPPGTGKTSFSQALADALGYDFISVSPSDFTRSGESGVEARAQQLFSVLSSQSRCVVLFDEIDRLLLDRDSRAYEEQGDIFQFMTPSMLTKINDLRKRERCVFIIATNYAERIDGAIKRPGRIDAQLLLMPPDLAQRTSIVGDVSKRAHRDSAVAGRALIETEQSSLANATPLYVFKELEAAVYEAQRWIAGGGEFNDFLKKLRSDHATVSLSSYKPRFPLSDKKELQPEKGPWLEVCMIAYLQQEVGNHNFPDWVREVIVAMRPQLDHQVAAAFAGLTDS